MPEFKEKFVAFVDILGFKDMVSDAETGTGRSLDDILELLEKLGQRNMLEDIQEFGPTICPMSACQRRDLDFKISRVSDCAIVSAEISPAAIINMVFYCQAVTASLLRKGVLVRGYLTRGSIYHVGQEFIGTGYQKALENERNVVAFSQAPSEARTPFIEIDPVVEKYVTEETDECVNTMYERMVSSDGRVAAVFPFKRLVWPFVLNGRNREEERKRIEAIQSDIMVLKERLTAFIESGNERASEKIVHYQRALDSQLSECSRAVSYLDFLP